MKINTKQLANSLNKIELKVDEKKKYFFYVEEKDNTHIIKSELNPAEFLAKHNLKKSAIK